MVLERFLGKFGGLVAVVGGVILMAPSMALDGQGTDGAERKAAPEMPKKPPKGDYRSSPIDFFRRLLEMGPDERQEALAGKEETKRQLIVQKVREYQSLSANERKVRLQVLELHWYVKPLLERSIQYRRKQLATIPPEDRELVVERLRQWDRLSSEVQENVLEHTNVMGYFLRRGVVYGDGKTAGGRAQLPPKPGNGDSNAASHDEAQVERVFKHLRRFFDLPEEKREQTLAMIASDRRGRTEATLEVFEELPPRLRAQCLKSLVKFSQMEPSEQKRFLENVQTWQSMTSDQREAWRKLVDELPPLPPGMEREEANRRYSLQD